LLIATVFFRMIFFYLWFSQNHLFFILFFNIELVKNYSYNMWGKHYNFPRKLLWIATVFFPIWFFFCFVIFFPKIIFVNFIFKILSWLRIAITSKYKFFLTKHYALIQFFVTWFFSSFFCVFFFCNIFFQNYLRQFVFLILSWLEFNFVIKLNHVGKAL
jgi:hypothetical protein